MKVTYIDHMGSDLSVVNAARVSFGKKSTWANADRLAEYPELPRVLSEADKSLIHFLARGCSSGDWEALLVEAQNGVFADLIDPGADWKEELAPVLRHIRRMPSHWTPFGHTAITLHVKAPLFVARQLGKHQVGFVWNEISRRYVKDEPEFYFPDTWRQHADNVKQGSSESPHPLWNRGVGTGFVDYIHDVCDEAYTLYNAMIEDGVCPEQARMVLPQSMYTEWYWTGNLYGFANVFIQRTDSHAQAETMEVARQIGEIIAPLFPESWKALTQ